MTLGDTKVSDDLEPSGKDPSDRTSIENFLFSINLFNLSTEQVLKMDDYFEVIAFNVIE